MAWGDYDNDGQLDFIITGQDSIGNWIAQLWRNSGSGFTNVAIPGLLGLPDRDAAWGDYDNDGRLDFLLDEQLWRNTGDGFTKVSVSGLVLEFMRRRGAIMTTTVAWIFYTRELH